MAYPRYPRYSETRSSYEPEQQQPAPQNRGSWSDRIGIAPVTLTLIVINVIIFILQNVPSTKNVVDAQALSLWAISNGMWWTVLTSMFMHGSIMHILCNMITLYYFGDAIERVFGGARFLILYLISGIAGGAVFIGVCMATHSNSSVVGASGAIFGLLGAYGVLLICEHSHPVLLSGKPSTSTLASYFILMAVNIAIGFTPGIAIEAHIGGVIAGAVVGLIMYSAAKKRMNSSGTRTFAG